MARNYNVTISFIGRDKASGPLGRIGAALGSISRIAGGILGANMFMGIGHQINQMGKDAFNAVAGYEQLGFAMESLIAREISKGEVVSTSSRAYVTALFQEQQSSKYLTTLLAEQQEALRTLNYEYQVARRETGFTIGQNMEWVASLKEAEEAIQYTKDGLASLSLWNGRVADQMSGEVVMGAKDISAAYEQAAVRADALLKWTRDLAIFSPFDMKTVADTIRMAMAYGFAEDQAKRLTTATVNYTAATGQAGDVSERISRALGQVQAKGRLMGEEIRQLTDASIPVVQILADKFGKTTQEITKMVRAGLVPADDAVQAIIESMEEFGPAAERQFETWKGLANAMGDVKELGLQAVFAPLLDIFKPFVAEWVRFMAAEGIDNLAVKGQALADNVMRLAAAWNLLTGNKSLDDVALSADTIAKIDTFKARLIEIRDFGTEAVEAIAPLAQYVDDVGVALGSLLVINKISSTFTGLSAALPAIGKALGGLVTLLGGPWAIALAAGIGLLYYAWTNNFMGMRDTLTEFWETTLKPFIDSIIPWFQEHIPLALQWLGDTWTLVWGKIQEVIQTVGDVLAGIWTWLQPIIQSMADYFKNVIWPVMQSFGNFIATIFTTVWTTLTLFFQNVVMPILRILGDWWQNVIWPILETVGKFIIENMVPYWEALGALFRSVILVVLRLVWQFLKNQFEVALKTVREAMDKWSERIETVGEFLNEKLIPALSGMWEWLEEKLKPIFKTLGEIILPILEGAFDAVAGAVSWLIDLIKKLISWLDQIGVPEDLVQHSPSPFEKSLIDMATQLEYLNSLPFMPQLQGVNMADVARGIAGLDTQLAPALAGIGQTVAGTEAIGPAADIDRGARQTTINIGTTLSREELIDLLEDLALTEGEF